MYKLRAFEPGDIYYLLANMRAADAAELAAQSGSDGFYDTISQSVRSAKKVYSLAQGRKVAAVCGYKDGVCGAGNAWTLTTTDAQTHKKDFLRATKEFLRECLEIYPAVYNIVDARYEKSIKWIKWFGGEIKDEVRINGFKFYIWTLQEADFYGKFGGQHKKPGSTE
jgi:hypothetical protein